MELIIGGTVDNIEWNYFGYYDLLQYWDKQISAENPKIVRCMGVSNRVVSSLCYWILTAKVTVVARTTVQHVTRDEVDNDDCQRRIT